MTKTPTALSLASFSAPQLALAALYFPVFVYLAPFYAEHRGLDLAAIGAVMVGARLLDAVSDPLMGALSDRWRTRFGRRKIWLAISTPLVCLTVWMAMRPPEDAGLGYFAFWLIAMTLSWTMALTPYLAWGGEIASDYAGRARASAWRESAFLIGTLVAAALYTTAGEAEAGLGAIALFVLIGLPLGAVAALTGAREPVDRSFSLSIGWRESRDALLANAPARRILASHFLNSAANALPATTFLFFVGAVLGGTEAEAGALLALYFLTAVMAAPFWLWAARRWSKHRAWGAAMIYNCFVFGCALLLGPGDLLPFALISAASGIAFGADIALPSAMQADVVDVDTARTGQQRTGLYFALWTVVTKASSAIAAGLAFWTLGLWGFVAGAESQSDAALMAVALTYAGAPILLKLGAVALIWRYPLDAEAQKALRIQIDAQSAERPA